MSFLSSLKDESFNKQLKIANVKTGDLQLKLYEMGIMPGQNVVVTRKAPFGGPFAIKVGTQVIMLRKEEAELIEIE